MLKSNAASPEAGWSKEIDELWDSLYLRPEEIAELLAFVKQHAFQPWVYPLVCAAAFTGARRSELLRLAVHDVDFSGDTITIHERKREHDKRTTRRVSLTPFLKNVLQEWMNAHSRWAGLVLPGRPGQCAARPSGPGRPRSPATRHTTISNRPCRTANGPW